MTASFWFLCLEKHTQELLKTADELLVRYPRQRRRSGPSFVGRIFAEECRCLRGYATSLDYEEQLCFAELLQKLEERTQRLCRRRVLSYPLLRKLHLQWRSLRDLSACEPKEWDSPSVLVGTLRRPSQLDVCLLNGFYHVPVGQISEDRLPVDYVAIYQSRRLFAKDCGIRYYGRVKQCTILRRWEIEEIPKSSDALYYRFDIESWEQLDVPIQVREVPFTHLFTNLFLLLHSKETPQLCLESPIQYRYYQAVVTALKRGDGPVFTHPGGKVILKHGWLQVRWRGRKIVSFRAEDFTVVPDSIFRRIMEILERNATK